MTLYHEFVVHTHDIKTKSLFVSKRVFCAISLFWSEVAEIFYEQQSPLLAVGRPDRQAIKEQKGNRQYMYLYTMYQYICRFVLTYKVAGNIEQVGIKR